LGVATFGPVGLFLKRPRLPQSRVARSYASGDSRLRNVDRESVSRPPGSDVGTSHQGRQVNEKQRREPDERSAGLFDLRTNEDGGGGIRTLVGGSPPKQFSRLPHSTALPPLRVQATLQG
jgi:hypothetical protein